MLAKILKKTLISIIALTFIFACASCKNANPSYVDAKVSVYFLDVHDGNATLIKTPTGKTFLIDCGGKYTSSDLVKRLKEYNVSKIDYLILSHFDDEHIGATETILDNFEVVCAYVPYIEDYSLSIFPSFVNIYDKLKTKLSDESIKTNKIFETIKEEDCILTFLSPEAPNIKNGEYKNLYSTLTPSEEQVDAISAVIYFRYKDVSFLFPHDAGTEQENKILEKDDINAYNYYFDGERKVDISEIDFLCVAREGGENASSEKFLNRLKPKNAIVSVSGYNSKGNPKLSVLLRIQSANPSCKIFRTDMCGDIAVFIDEETNYKIYKQNEL